MNFILNKQVSPLQLTFKFIVYLIISYLIYFSFLETYASLLMMISSNIVANIFDMNLITNGNYLQDSTLVSKISFKNNITDEIAFAQLPLSKIVINKILLTITNTPVILALSMLLVRSIKTLVIIFSIMLTIHIMSVSAVLSYFMFEVAPQSPLLMSYLQTLAIPTIGVDISYLLSAISFYYLKFFTPFALAYYAWEVHDFKFIVKSRENLIQPLNNLILNKRFIR